jgi:hypothetical protein
MMYNDAKLKAILADPCTSYWLEKSIKELLHRDPVDSVRDAEVLCDLMKDRERQALGITEPKKPWPVIFCDGGLVQAVITLDSLGGSKAIEYELMDYDVFEDQDSKDIAEYWERRSPELRAYMKDQCNDEYTRFEEIAAEAKKPKTAEQETPIAQLLRVATDTLNTLKELQEQEYDPSGMPQPGCDPHGMPWPQIDNLEQAISRMKEAS